MTPPVPQLIAGCGFAGMAWELALRRSGNTPYLCSEYYRIIDRAEWLFEARRQSPAPDIKNMVLV